MLTLGENDVELHLNFLEILAHWTFRCKSEINSVLCLAKQVSLIYLAQSPISFVFYGRLFLCFALVKLISYFIDLHLLMRCRILSAFLIFCHSVFTNSFCLYIDKFISLTFIICIFVTAHIKKGTIAEKMKTELWLFS